MFSDLLSEGRVVDAGKQRAYLGIISAETARLTRLINNVLDFARIDRGEKKYDFESCDVVALVRDTAECLRPHLEATGFAFNCALPDDPIFVNGDRDSLAQVVVNLVSNAEKYSPTRKEILVELGLSNRSLAPRGAASQRSRDGRASRDRGKDVREILSRSRFAEQRNTRLRIGPNTRERDCSSARRHAFLSTTRRRRQLLHIAPAVKTRSFLLQSLATDRMKSTILIVEDDPHILLGLQEVLKSDGFEVVVAARGDLVFEAVTQHRPRLIILDIMLPGLSGYEVCRALRAKKVNTPILMLTAKSQEIDKVVGLELGADDYVSKPFGVRELLARIHALLRRVNSNAENNSGFPEHVQDWFC